MNKIPKHITNLPIYKAFKRSPYKSTKHLSYFDTYNELLTKYINKPITFVEIGVLDGGSLFMWRNFFGKKARIIGVEFNPEAKKWEKEGFEIYIGSQSDEKFWSNFFKKIGSVDIVLDDGGHTNEQQIITTHNCLPFIKNNGMLIIEDTHSSYMMKFGNPSKFSFIEWSKKIVDNLNSRSKGIPNLNLVYKKYIQSIHFFESIVCFNVNRNKCINSYPIANMPGKSKARDYRLKGTSLWDINFFKSRYRFWLIFKIKNHKLKKFFFEKKY